MHTASSPSLNRWKTLYQAAILETNKGLLPQRVAEAEEAVKARGREIFHGNGTPEEKGSRSIAGRTLYLACVQNRLAAQRNRLIPEGLVMLLP
jgi:hypothetical protein